MYIIEKHNFYVFLFFDIELEIKKKISILKFS